MATTLATVLEQPIYAPQREPERAAHVTSGRAERAGRRYVMTLLVVCVVLYAAPFVAERVPRLQRYAASDLGLRLDYTDTLNHADADVVIFGDSSALYGIDAERLSRELGVNAVNLPVTIGSLAVSSDAPLRRYLQHNRAPRVIVLAFMPWNTDFRALRTGKVYEGVEQVIRHGSARELLHVLWRRPADLATFPFAFYRVSSALTRLGRRAETAYALRSGFEPYPAQRSALGADCVLPDSLLAAGGERSFATLRDDVNSERTAFVTVLSPVPQCKGAERLRERFGAALQMLPPSQFEDDTLLSHLRPGFTDAPTDRVAAAIRAGLKSRGR